MFAFGRIHQIRHRKAIILGYPSWIAYNKAYDNNLGIDENVFLGAPITDDLDDSDDSDDLEFQCEHLMTVSFD
jgi:hypothetical protein